MSNISDLILGYNGQNPFSDSQPRNFSDTKIINEFYPISKFWSLFNDQHEILLGTRGSGKTFLLKMMRYSMLKRIQDPQAKQLISDKRFLALYVPMYLEFVTHFTSYDIPVERQIQLFQFAFNCLLAESLLSELTVMIDDEPNIYEKAKLNLALALELNDIWFDEGADDISDLFSLTTKIKKLYYSFDAKTSNIDQVPTIFKRQICSSLLSVKEIISKKLRFEEEPTWIICIDEAEFLKEPLLKCINNVFRSDSKRIALKVATLPYYHKTLETLEPNITASAGNDFNYRVVDMSYDSMDFLNLTNNLCSHRIKTRFKPSANIDKLEDFVGVVGKDDQIDYYREEFGAEKSTREYIERDMVDEFSDVRKRGAANYNNRRKTVYDKFAPVFFTRQMYKLSRKGNSKPGWYAGSPMIRKISQGNPRLFIQIMNELFEKARVSVLTPKAQHEVTLKYVHSFCEATQGLEIYGPTIYAELKDISLILQNRVHEGHLISTGSSFVLSYEKNEFFIQAKDWLQLAIAYSRLVVDEETLKNGVTPETKYLLANMYAAEYWIPMRADGFPQIKITDNKINTYTVKNESSSIQQLSLFEEE